MSLSGSNSLAQLTPQATKANQEIRLVYAKEADPKPRTLPKRQRLDLTEVRHELILISEVSKRIFLKY